ncbi:MAG: hypothetical protein GX801_03085 [Fibrobacter sp.]|nr:hypothetical protein [Fibrobacter sp.]
MAWQCKYLVDDSCKLRNTKCIPGDKGCILRQKYSFPFMDEKPNTPAKTKSRSRPK